MQNESNRKRNMQKIKKKTAFVWMIAALSIASCGHGGDSHGEPMATEDEHDHGNSHADEIVISTEKAKAAGITVETVEPGTFHGVIAAGGKIMEASGDERTIVASTDGIVRFTRQITEGTSVPQGAAILSIAGNHLQGGGPASQAKIAYEKALEEYTRAQKLVTDKIISEKDFNAIKADYEAARLAYEATPTDDAGGVAVKSPISGYVKTCLVKDGDYVTTGQPLLSVTQNRRLYLRADVPQRHYAEVSGVAAAVFKPSYTDKTFDTGELGGRLVAIGKPSTDAPGYIPVTFEFNNADGILPGSFAEVWLSTATRNDVVTLPLSAITEEQGVNFVYVQDDPTCYTKREVTLGQSDGRRVEVAGGLHSGERVVTQGAIHVKLASASNAIPAHTHEH